MYIYILFLPTAVCCGIGLSFDAQLSQSKQYIESVHSVVQCTCIWEGEGAFDPGELDQSSCSHLLS